MQEIWGSAESETAENPVLQWQAECSYDAPLSLDYFKDLAGLYKELNIFMLKLSYIPLAAADSE